MNKPRELVQMIHAHHFIRNGVKHEDGSMGTVVITPKELRDALAYAFMAGVNDGSSGS